MPFFKKKNSNMKKRKLDINTKVQKMIQIYPDFTSTSTNTLICRICNNEIKILKKYNLENHLKTEIHQKFKKILSNNQLITDFTVSSPQNSIHIELLEAMIDSNVSFNVLNNEKMRNFLKTHFNFKPFDESHYRKNILPILYERKIKKIISILSNKYFALFLDESTDTRMRRILNILVYPLTGEKEKKYLVSSIKLEVLNSSEICKSINDCIVLISNGKVDYSKFLVLITDSSSYFKKAFKSLKIFYTNCIHINCLFHFGNILCEFIRLKFDLVNSFISSVKKIFNKSPKRIKIFSENLPNISIPPKVKITRFGSWIEACSYYVKNFDSLGNVINKLKEKDNYHIVKLKTLYSKNELKNELIYIHSNFSQLPIILKEFEKEDNSLDIHIKLFNQLKDICCSKDNEFGFSLKKKFQEIKEKNIGIEFFEKVNKILNGEKSILFYPTNLISLFKYLDLTTCAVERSFSCLKRILTGKNNYNIENLGYYLIISYNK